MKKKDKPKCKVIDFPNKREMVHKKINCLSVTINPADLLIETKGNPLKMRVSICTDLGQYHIEKIYEERLLYSKFDYFFEMARVQMKRLLLEKEKGDECPEE